MNFPLVDALCLAAVYLLVLATLPGTLYLLVLSTAGLRRIRASLVPASAPTAGWKEPAIAIIVPAHNESSGIARTVQSLNEIARRDGSATVVVIADNCTDDTADNARAMGARVLERQDDARRGKGYALDFAFRTLASEGFYGYVVIDADTIAEANLLSAIRSHFAAGAKAV